MRSKSALSLMGMLMVLLIGTVSAVAQDIKFNFLPGTDFAKYRTYKWARVPNAQYPNQLLDGPITQAIDAQLAMKIASRQTGTTLLIFSIAA